MTYSRGGYLGEPDDWDAHHGEEKRRTNTMRCRCGSDNQIMTSTHGLTGFRVHCSRCHMSTPRCNTAEEARLFWKEMLKIKAKTGFDSIIET